jgi:cytidylate kinase
VIRIAVDGPSGSGKSTIAKAVANKLRIDYIDTGAMYRAIALKMLETGTPTPDSDPDETDSGGSGKLEEMLGKTTVDFDGGRILLDGDDVSGKIRTPEVTKLASESSALPVVREKLVALQRAMGEKKSVIMDGRDIGSNVFKDAEYKFYMTASAEERARRRYAELREKGIETDYDTVLGDIVERDYNDSHRSLNPLVKCEDAIEIDTDNLGIEAVTERLLAYIR